MSYTRDIYAVFHQKPVPRGVVVDLVEYDGFFALRFYRENFDSQSESTRVAATEWALETAKNMNAIIPTDIEVRERLPEDK